jgi:uncharacterized iron-regulated membrane protein
MCKATKATRGFKRSENVRRMKESFRQSMGLLHSWLGLSAGWLLFFVFLTGTTGFVHSEISRWMRPELPLVGGMPAASEMLPVAEKYLAENASSAEFWSIFFPGHKGAQDLAVTWREPRREATRALLDATTGEVVQRKARDTGGGYALYAMHYALHYVSKDAATFVVGVAAMMMLVSILTGVAGHSRVLRDVFKLRAGAGPASWRSRHALVGVLALPFFLVMTWSGLMFFLFQYMPVAQAALFSSHEEATRFNVEAYFPPDRPYGETMIVVPPSITSLPEVLSKAEALWGRGNVSSIRVDSPGRANMRVTAYTWRADIKAEARVAFDETTGEPIPLPRPRTTTAKFYETMIGLHKAHYAPWYLKALYILCGSGGTILVGTGLVHWCARRRARATNTPRAHFVIALVDRINLATVIGLPIALAAYFWANRILPLDTVKRAAWETHIMFIVWGAAFLYAGLRPRGRGWWEMCAIAGVVYGLIPVLNAFTTERHLGVTLPAGDWGLAGLDLTAFALSAFFAMLAVSIRRGQSAVKGASSTTEPAQMPVVS